MVRPPLIGFAGKARSGKDTAADFTVAIHGGYRYSFADPIRAMLLPLGIDMRDQYWIDHKEDIIPALGVSPRHMMQTLGTDWGRKLINGELWLTMASHALAKKGPGMIISDIRFENEADWVRRVGGTIVHISRPAAASVKAHVSEDGIMVKPQYGDLIVVNDGDLEALHTSIGGLVWPQNQKLRS